jgi:putative ABC transport system permease protein
MTFWLAAKTGRRTPRRLVLGAIGVAFPVAMLAAILFFVDQAARSMTQVALRPVQTEMRALATSLNVNMADVTRKLASVPGVTSVDRFGSTDVVVGTPGAPGQWTARLFAVDPKYLKDHPWVRVVHGGLGQGALLDQSLLEAPGFPSAKTITIGLPGDAPPLSVSLPVNGLANLRDATTFFSIPYGEVQGDVVTLPRALVIPYSTFEREILPVLQKWATKGGITPVFDPGSTDLPPISMEAHVSVAHSAYPPDPGRAVAWSTALRRILERKAPGQVLVADNTTDPLTLASADATNAKILFLLLGIPGALVAAALGLAAASALAEAHRQEEALLRLRGATDGQVARLAATHAGIAGLTGSILGLAVAGAAVSAVLGRPFWQGVPASRLILSTVVALVLGAVTTAVRLIRLLRSGRRSEVAVQRRILERGWSPAWRRAHLDLIAIGVGVVVLGINVLAGGLTHDPIEGTSLALSFYVLLAPIALWLGVTLLAVRGLLALLGRRARPELSRPLTSWQAAGVRWLGRRPARTAVALLLGALAIAFGTEVVAFAATYDAAKLDDARAALGSNLRLTPGDPLFTLPKLGSDVTAVSPFRLVPSRAGSDRKTVLALDLPTYQAVSTVAPAMLSGQGPAALARDPLGVLVSHEIANDFQLRPGDTLPLTIFPDDFEMSTNLKLHVLGVYRSFPPTSPPADTPPELVMGTNAVPRAVVVPPDYYLARVAPGHSATAVAAKLKHVLADKFGVATVSDANQRGLTALNLSGLSRIESIGGALVAAVGVAVLGAFLVLERRREFAILRALGAGTSQVLTGPAQEGAIAVLGSLVIGVPVGLALSFLAVRILGLFFTLPPPLIVIPGPSLIGLVLLTAIASTAAIGVALTAVNRVRPAAVLREL